jgi:hypothetical protein
MVEFWRLEAEHHCLCLHFLIEEAVACGVEERQWDGCRDLIESCHSRKLPMAVSRRCAGAFGVGCYVEVKLGCQNVVTSHARVRWSVLVD